MSQALAPNPHNGKSATPLIIAAHTWRNNAELIADVARLGYINIDDKVLDPTYGRGKWWTEFCPTNLTKHDKYTLDGMDFRDLPYPDNSFRVVAFDPPYVSKGGRKTTTMHDFQDRYGMGTAPGSPAELQELINDGLTEAARLASEYVLAKVQNYISSGKYWNGTYHTEKHAIENLGLTVCERFVHLTKKSKPQPAGKFVEQEDGEKLWVPRKQRHARNNTSYLFVFQKTNKKGDK